MLNMFDEQKGFLGVASEGGLPGPFSGLTHPEQNWIFTSASPSIGQPTCTGYRAEQQGLGIWEAWQEGWAGCEEGGRRKAAALLVHRGSPRLLQAMDN